MLRFATQPPRKSRRKDRTVRRRDVGALDTPARTELAARAAGVELVVTGPESREGTGLRARVRRGERMPDELGTAIGRHRVGIIARLLAREPVTGDVPGVLATLLQEHRGGRATLGDPWPEECLVSQATAGHRCARLYPLLHADVLVGGRADGRADGGTLLQAMGGRAMVFVEGDPKVAPFGDEKRAFVPARSVPVADVWPPVPRATLERRSSRLRQRGEVADLDARRPFWTREDDGGGEGDAS